jgi:hypothetical protein
MNEHDPYHHYNFSPNVATVLKQRGFVRTDCCSKATVIEPANPTSALDLIEPLGSRTVRKLLRRVSGEAAVDRNLLLEICAEPKLNAYLSRLEGTGTVRADGNRVALSKYVDNFGPTLEWYVAMVFQDAFNATSCWSVQLEEIYGGGDFDVLAWLDSSSALVYVECKSASPASISDDEIRCFFQRCQELGPEVAILLVDTDSPLNPFLDRVQELLVPVQRLASGIRDEGWVPDHPFIAPIPGLAYAGLHFGLHRVFITGSEPSIATQLRKCLRYYSSWVSHLTFFSPVRTDYIRGELMTS